ncbi:aspartic proteinase CDR1-like [Melia azedarach]|uniref:Aspartic proteinase CDR1-like n=1 Tax=Melia azedarach TaxID=155640 RepID=A0ACC1YD39_MELAZ|nr:aspartic proteinase CDR1-like [Melia azedarach]
MAAACAIHHSLLSFLFAISCFVICFSCISLTDAQTGGFSVELIHRDSPKSPFHNPNETSYTQVINALHRSFNRVKLIDAKCSSPGSAEADIVANDGEFLMEISIGTPPVEMLAIADTGSDLIWTQCIPCIRCFKQKAPLFNPSLSSTYYDLPCLSNQCSSMDGTSCSVLGTGDCVYSVTYGDNSFSNGSLALDTITLGSTSGLPVAFPKTIIGCGHDNGGIFSPKSSGIVGLGGGNVSLVSQLGPLIAGKFSYCLVPVPIKHSRSKINFGTNGVVPGSGLPSTPLIAKDPKTFYFVTLEAISVGKHRIPVDNLSFGASRDGNIIIDSGTTFTLLPKAFNSKVLSAVSSVINAIPVADPKGTFDLCYNISTHNEFSALDITVHFTGANVKLSALNTIARISDEIICLAFQGVNLTLGVYGFWMQTNFLVGYDIEQRTVSFQPIDCSLQ